MQDKPSLITLTEIETGKPAEPAAPAPAPAPAATPAPVAPAPADTPPVVDPLAGLFGGPPAVNPEPPAPVPADEPPADATPQWYREAIKRNTDTFAQRQAEADSARIRAEEEAAQLREQLAAAHQEQVLIDPMQSPDVQQLSAHLTNEIKGVARALSPKAAREFLSTGKPLIEKYSALGEVYDEGYDDRYQELRKEVNATYGADADEVFRNLHRLSGIAADMRSKVIEATGNSEEIMHTRMERAHLEAARGLDDIYGSTLAFSEELSKANPFAPQNVISRLIDGVPEFKQHSDQIKAMLKGSLIPPRPLSRTQLAAMTPEQRNQAQAQRNQHYQEAYQGVYKAIPLALHALAALPIITEQLAQAKQREASLRALMPNPPPPGTIPTGGPAPAVPAPPSGGFRPITAAELGR